MSDKDTNVQDAPAAEEKKKPDKITVELKNNLKIDGKLYTPGKVQVTLEQHERIKAFIK